MRDFNEKERDLIERFKVEYKMYCYKLDDLERLKHQIEVIDNEMMNIRSTSLFDIKAGKSSSKEVDNDKRMAVLIQKKQKCEELNLPRIMKIEHIISNMDVPVLFNKMNPWAQYLMRRVYRDGITFEEVSSERKDCNFSRSQLSRKLGNEILRVFDITKKDATRFPGKS